MTEGILLLVRGRWTHVNEEIHICIPICKLLEDEIFHCKQRSIYTPFLITAVQTGVCAIRRQEFDQAM